MAEVRYMQKIIADVKAVLLGLTADLRVDGIHKSTTEWQVKKMVV